MQRLLTALALAAAAGCSEAAPRQAARADGAADSARRDSIAAVLAASAPAAPDTGVPTPIAASLSRAALVRRRPPVLSAAADSLAERLVFVPRTQTWFIAAARGKRMLVDLGRVDADLRTAAPPRRAAYQEAVAKLSPLPSGVRVRLRGPWGTEDATVSGFDAWNGRIVATLAVSPALDSLARRRDPLIGTAFRLPDSVATDSLAADSAARADSAATRTVAAGGASTGGASASAAARDSASRADSLAADSLAALACVRDSVPAVLLERASLVRDSLAGELREKELPPYDRLKKSVSVSTSITPGCYGPLGRVLVVASLRSAGNQWVRERVVVLDSAGVLTPLRVSDYRFKGHDPLYAFDADGDGVDDVAARAVAERAGGTVVLRLDPGRRRADRIAGGFAWETQ